MKLELLDPYNIRVRLSVSVILFSPIAITTFLCFEEINTLASSSVFIFVLLSFTNYLPIMQRYINKDKFSKMNYAAQFLLPSDTTIDRITKARYYEKLAKVDKTYEQLKNSDDNENHALCCNSAVSFLKIHTRKDHLVQEENINYGFCKNLLANKTLGIVICSIFMAFISIFSIVKFGGFSDIPVNNYFAFLVNLSMLMFWIWGINKKMVDNAAKYYAKALLSSIETLS